MLTKLTKVILEGDPGLKVRNIQVLLLAFAQRLIQKTWEQQTPMGRVGLLSPRRI